MKKLYTNTILLLFLIFLTSCSRDTDSYSAASENPESLESQSIAVEALTVSSSLLVTEIRGAGVAEGIREAWVVSETEGLVRQMAFNLGDSVAEGQVILSVDADLAARNKDLAEQQYKTARLEYEAAERSSSNGSMSTLQFSQVTDRLLAVEASRTAAYDAYENSFLRAPFAGVVAVRDRGIGIGTLLSRGIRVARIVDDSSFRTEISVGEGQVLLVREGADSRITGNDGVVRYGTVTAVSAGSDAGTGGYTVVMEWTPEPGDRLRSGMSVDVSVNIDGETPRVIVPSSSIRLRGGSAFVYVSSEGIAELRDITTGSRLGDRVEVLSGLVDGETLIISGLASLTPGIPLSVSIVGQSGDA